MTFKLIKMEPIDETKYYIHKTSKVLADGTEKQYEYRRIRKTPKRPDGMKQRGPIKKPINRLNDVCKKLSNDQLFQLLELATQLAGAKIDDPPAN